MASATRSLIRCEWKSSDGRVGGKRHDAIRGETDSDTLTDGVIVVRGYPSQYLGAGWQAQRIEKFCAAEMAAQYGSA